MKLNYVVAFLTGLAVVLGLGSICLGEEYTYEYTSSYSGYTDNAQQRQQQDYQRQQVEETRRVADYYESQQRRASY